jgi:hypothetical protein
MARAASGRWFVAGFEGLRAFAGVSPAARPWLRLTTPVRAFALHPSEETLVTAGFDHALRFYDLRSASETPIATLTPDDRAADQSFTLQDVSIGRDVYVKIDTDSPALAKTIPASPQWRHFDALGIPPQFEGIATAGPILDNLRIFSEKGAYLDFQHKVGPETIGELSLVRYTFRLSSRRPADPDDSLVSIMDEIADGTVEVWIDPDHMVRMLSFRSPGYSSTTTLSAIDIPQDIGPPAGVR